MHVAAGAWEELQDKNEKLLNIGVVKIRLQLITMVNENLE
jgi:hypothetical protein